MLLTTARDFKLMNCLFLEFSKNHRYGGLLSVLNIEDPVGWLLGSPCPVITLKDYHAPPQAGLSTRTPFKNEGLVTPPGREAARCGPRAQGTQSGPWERVVANTSHDHVTGYRPTDGNRRISSLFCYEYVPVCFYLYLEMTHSVSRCTRGGLLMTSLMRQLDEDTTISATTIA